MSTKEHRNYYNTNDAITNASENYPHNYKTWYTVSIFVYLVLYLSPIVIHMIFFPGIFHFFQRKAIASDAMFFFSDSGYIVALPLMFFLLVFVAIILSILLEKILPKGFIEYSNKQAAINTGMTYDENKMMKYACYLSILLLIFTLSVSFFALHRYIAVYEDKIIYSGFFDMKSELIPLDRIDLVETTILVNSKKLGTKIEIYNPIKKIQFNDDYAPDMEKQISGFYNLISNKDIPIYLTELDQEILDKLDHYRLDKQKVILAIDGCYMDVPPEWCCLAVPEACDNN